MSEIASGSIRFNTDSRKMEIYNGEAWWEIDSTSPEEQTGGTRALFAGGNAPSTAVNEIEFINVDSTGNASDFGNLTNTYHGQASCSSRTRGLTGGGQRAPVSQSNAIEFVTISSTGDMTDFGDLTDGRDFISALASSTRGIFSCGRITTPATGTNTLDYVTIAQAGNAVDFGDVSGGVILFYAMTCASPTRGIFTGGSPDFRDEIEYLTISTLGNTADFGNTSAGHAGGQGCSNAIRGIFGGGYAPGVSNIIDFITIATRGNTQDFGDLPTAVDAGGSASSSPVRVIVSGGGTGPNSGLNNINYVNIATQGNAVDFGDRTNDQKRPAAVSNANGGL